EYKILSRRSKIGKRTPVILIICSAIEIMKGQQIRTLGFVPGPTQSVSHRKFDDRVGVLLMIDHWAVVGVINSIYIVLRVLLVENFYWHAGGLPYAIVPIRLSALVPKPYPIKIEDV